MRIALVLCFGFVAFGLSGCEIIKDGAKGEIFGGGGPEIVWMNDSNASYYNGQEQ